MLWHTGERFEFDQHLLNGRYEPVAPGTVVAAIAQGDDSISVLTWDHPDVAANANLAGPRGQVVLPAWASGRFTLTLRHVQSPACSAAYRLLLRRTAPDA